MQQKSRSLQARLDDVSRRLRAMRTVTNTASAEISGGETVIDSDGSVFFSDGGRLTLGNSSITTSSGSEIIDASGNLSVDSLVIYGDILSARDYMFQREVVSLNIVDTNVVSSVYEELYMEFPDWASSVLMTFTFYINTRFSSSESNPLLVTINGKPVARPRTNNQGDIVMHSTVVRRIVPETPRVLIEVRMGEEPIPTASPRVSVTASGVYSV